MFFDSKSFTKTFTKTHHVPFTLKILIIPIYSSPDSSESEEISSSSLICLVTFVILQCTYILLKTLENKFLHILKTESIKITDRQIQ